MMNNQFVVDANVFAKLFIEEADSDQAKNFMKHCVQHEISLLVPSLFTYEILQIATYYAYPLPKALGIIDDYKAFNLSVIELNIEQWELAGTITQSGHKQSGYPSLYDSCYHSLAIKNDCLFVTADKRHAAKTESFGHLLLLKDWNTESNIAD